MTAKGTYRPVTWLAAALAMSFPLVGAIAVNAFGAPSDGAGGAHQGLAFRTIAELDHPGGRAVVFSADGTRILTAGKSAVQVWDAKTYKPLGEPMEHGDDLRQVALDRHGERVLTAGWESERGKLVAGEAIVWEAKTGKRLVGPIRHGDQPVSYAAISPDGTLAATCFEEDRDVRVWDVATGRQRVTLHQDGRVLGVLFDPTGELLISGGAVDTIWDTKSWKVRGSYAGTTAEGPPLPAIAARAKRVAIPGESWFAVYDLAGGKRVADNHEHFLHLDEFLAGIAISPDGHYVATTSTAGGAVWDGTTGEPFFKVSDGFWGTPVFSPDGRHVVFGTLKPDVWSVPSGAHTRLEGDRLDLRAACFSTDGKRLAVGTFRGSTVIFAVGAAEDVKVNGTPPK
jgi:WD40 repeat protein